MKYNLFCTGAFRAAAGGFDKRCIGYAEDQPNGRIYAHFDAFPVAGSFFLDPIPEEPKRQADLHLVHSDSVNLLNPE